MYKFLFTCSLVFFNLLPLFSSVDISLSGKWMCRIDSLSVGEKNHWENDNFSRSITLPGSTDEIGIGNTYPIFKSILGCDRFADYPQNADFGMLTRKNKYIGKVWYQKEITLTPEEKGVYSLFLERVMWRSKVWVDGRMIGDAIDFLSSPHTHFIGMLDAGKHTITIMVDNSEIYPIGTLGHSYCPHMQTQWNGIVGSIGLNKHEDVSIKSLNVYPSYKDKNVKVIIDILRLESSSINKAKLFLKIKDKQTNEYVCSHTYKENLSEKDKLSYNISLQNPKSWDEFEPNLYQIEVQLSTSNSKENKTAVFGFRDLGVKDKHFTINGRKIIYRNSHEGMCFPNTGYPEMNVDYWRKIWKLYKEHGFNAVRFHSSCPPEAAFIAADEVGLYMQVEFFWKDGWMGWKDLIGQKDKRLNDFVYDEVIEALRNYGNHPSMMLVAFGNELGGNFDWMGECIKEMKEFDPRHFYAAGIAHDITEYDDFVEYGGKNQAQKYNGTDWDYSYNYIVSSAHNYDDKFRRKNLPEFTHETGQYIVHPLWSEIEKYNGALDPLNLKYYKSIAEKNGIACLDYELQKASGQINKNLYKAEIEATLRTPESAGYSLLSMVDYPGQGEALVGWVDPFYKNKNFMTPKEFAMFGTHTVPLLRFAKYVWEDGEIFSADIEIANYGKDSLMSKVICYNVFDNGKLISSGNFSDVDIPQGGLLKIGRFTSKLDAGKFGKKIDIQVEILGTSYKNKWSVWVFPKGDRIDNSKDIIQTSSLDVALEELKRGKKVLLMADKLGNRQNKIYSAFNPVFWSATWFTGQDTDVSGAYIRTTHPALSLFPTEDVMDWQWEDVCRKSRGFILNDFPKDYFPIVQPVNDFHHGNKLGTVFELRTSEGGKLMVCGYNIMDSLDVRLAARQLKYSLLAYMSSDNFNPKQLVEYNWLKENLKDDVSVLEKEKKDLNAIFFVTPDSSIDFSRLSKWKKGNDNVIVNEDDYDYSIECDGIWQDSKSTYWVGKQIILEIKVNHPKLMNLKMCFWDSNNSNRSGVVKCEDAPAVNLGNHEKETWISIPITRENCLDGVIKVTIECNRGPNIMLNKFALTLQ